MLFKVQAFEIFRNEFFASSIRIFTWKVCRKNKPQNCQKARELPNIHPNSAKL